MWVTQTINEDDTGPPLGESANGWARLQPWASLRLILSALCSLGF